MQFLSIREFSKAPRAALSKLARDGKAVLTSNGKPAAIMINANAENFERVFNLVQQVEKTAGNVTVHHPEGSEQERHEAFERLMNFPRRLAPDFDWKKELMESIDERYGPVN